MRFQYNPDLCLIESSVICLEALFGAAIPTHTRFIFGERGFRAKQQEPRLTPTRPLSCNAKYVQTVMVGCLAERTGCNGGQNRIYFLTHTRGTGRVSTIYAVHRRCRLRIETRREWKHISVTSIRPRKKRKQGQEVHAPDQQWRSSGAYNIDLRTTCDSRYQCCIATE